jgi:hypothetical protein
VSDQRLRELERRYLAERDAESESALLHALRRHGQLPRPRLLLAAYLGSEGAARLLGARGFPEEPNLRSWIRGLGAGRLARSPRLSHEASVRVAVAALAVLDERGLLTAGAKLALEHARFWLSRRSELSSEALQDLRRLRPGLPSLLADVVLARDCEAAASAAASLVKEAASALRGHQRNHNKFMRAAITSALVPWVLVPEATM